MEKGEQLISIINSNIFFKEFTFSRNEFLIEANKFKLELADNVVWLDELLFIYQIKDRNASESTSSIEQWFKSKVLNKAVKQIKNTVKYLRNFRKIEIANERGHTQNLSDANVALCRKVIIYNPKEDLPNDLHFQKFYDSSVAGLIHLFHLEDYLHVCQYLITPAEIEEYFSFRESLYENHEIVNGLPEQYVLGHFLSGENTDSIKPELIEALEKLDENVSDFLISHILEVFSDRIKLLENETDYYLIIKEIAKLKRYELKEFKLRLELCFKQAGKQEFSRPYRITVPRTGCGFVFIPLEAEFKDNWRIALNNYTLAHKYDQKIDKCIGVLIYQGLEEKEWFEAFWLFANYNWEYEKEIEYKLRENFPFREVKTVELNRYKIKKSP